jgi:type I restriction enzyme S subunit
MRLGDVCDYVKDRTTDFDESNYISTENMLPDKGGITAPTNVPSGAAVAYSVSDVLVSNIRPYFRKIWFADRRGGCSADVLVFRARENCDSLFLRYALSSDEFFDYSTSTSKGTKMPRGDKSAIMEYDIGDLPPLTAQREIATSLSALDDKIAVNTKLNHRLEQMAAAIFKSWFVDFEPWGGVMPADWREGTLGEVAMLSAGGDKPTACSSVLTEECSTPIYSNGIDNFGLYGYTNSPKIIEESVTVSARGTIGFVCLRQEPFVPIVRLVTVIPKSDFVTAKYLYLYLSTAHIAGVGTTQQQLTVPDFKKFSVLVPNRSAVSDFSQAVEPVFESIRHNREDNAKLAALRDSLLPKLMSGELSVNTDFPGH